MFKFSSKRRRPESRPRHVRRTRRIVFEPLEDRRLLSVTPQLLKDIATSGTQVSSQYLFADVDGVTLFAADDGVHGTQLWKSDGTVVGTSTVQDIPPDINNPEVTIDGIRFFVRTDPNNLYGRELWKSDGTEAGTRMVKDINSGPGGSNPQSLANFNGTLYFTANTSPFTQEVRELWKSDGTAGGTVQVTHVNDDQPFPFGTLPSNPIDVNGTVFFVNYDDIHGLELWKQTPSGPVLVKDIFPGSEGSNIDAWANVDGTLYFSAADSATPSPFGPLFNQELWKSDGTEAGTVMVKDFSQLSYPRSLENVNGTLYFSAFDSTHGHELWRSDGTEAGTVIVYDIVPGSSSSAPVSLSYINGTLFFSASDGTTGREPWILVVDNRTPVVANRIPPVVVDLGAPDTTIDLSTTFSDADVVSGYDSLTFSIVGNTNPAIVSPAVSGNLLTLSYLLNFGSARLTVRATDLQGAFRDSFVDVTVNPLIPSTATAVDASDSLVISDATTLSKNDNFSVLYDSGTEKIVIQDLNGNPIYLPMGAGNGTSTVSISPSSFSGNIIFNLGLGSDRLTVNESISGSGKNIQLNGGAGNDTLSVVGSGGTAVYTPGTAGTGTVIINGSTTVSFTGLEPVDISGMGTATVKSPANPANAIVLNAGFDDMTGTIPALVVSGTTDASAAQIESARLFNNTNVIIDTSATTGTGTNRITVSATGAGSGHGNTDITLKTNANGSITFDGNLLATGTVTIDSPTLNLKSDIDAQSTTATSALTTINVAPSGSIQDAVDLATTGDTINVAGGTYLGALHLNKSLYLHLAQGVVVTLAAGTNAIDFQNTVSVLQASTAVGAPQVVHLVTGPELGTVVNAVPQLDPSGTFVDIVLRVTGSSAAAYDAGDNLLTVAFVNGPTISQQLDELNPGQRKLVVTGTPGNDSIAFKQMGDVVDVVIAGFATGSFLPTSRLVAFGLDGDDVIEATNAVNLSAWQFGDNGNDVLKGGKGSDVLQGGANNDQLVSGGGRDILIGGGGSDAVGGGGGEDIAISGTTTFDANNAALLAILSEWNSARSYSERVANILGTGTGASYAARLNENYFLNVDTTRGTVTVLDDDAQDTLSGGAGVDLYFANLNLDGDDQAATTDIITSVSKTEQAIDTDALPPPPPPPPPE